MLAWMVIGLEQPDFWRYPARSKAVWLCFAGPAAGKTEIFGWKDFFLRSQPRYASSVGHSVRLTVCWCTFPISAMRKSFNKDYR